MLYYLSMKKFEVLPHPSGASLKLRASTRAGLITAALQGTFAAEGARTDEESDEKLERPFTLAAPDFPHLLASLLDLALSDASANGEAYDDVHFTLITDKKAEGSFVGKHSKGFAKKIASVSPEMTVEKNVVGEWETTIVLKK
jgi:hypothetical protein